MNVKASSGEALAPALLRLEEFAALRVSGEDRLEFLQGQLSQDLAQVSANQAAPAAWCNRQGRVLCLMVAIEWKDATYLVLPAEMAETCATGLGRFILRAKVRIERWEGEPGSEGVPPGNEGVPALDAGSEGVLPSSRAGTPSFPGVFGCVGFESLSAEPWACRVSEEYCAVRLPGKGRRALLLGKPPAAAAMAVDAGWTADKWKLADIEAELPWVGAQASGKFLAHSLNLDLSGAVSFTKGCYVGQEIIARMEYRGKPKRRMRLITLPPGGGAEPGEKVEHPELGAVTVITAAPAGDHIEALAEVRLKQDAAKYDEHE